MTGWLRTGIMLTASITALLSLATQFVAASFGHGSALGPGVARIGAVTFHAPWDVLVWTWRWSSHDPWLAFLHLLLVAVCMLAAFAAAALVAAIEPPTFAPPFVSRGFARWRTLSHQGLLRSEGLALGAVHRHALAKHDFIVSPRGHVLMLGHPAYTDAALLAAIARWRGALVIVDARNLSACVAKADMLRFAPGRVDAIAINPLTALRGGAHAWSDALLLARAFLRSDDALLTESFAALALDTLAHAPPLQRSLAGMRQALASPERRLAELCSRWADAASDLGPATGELQRVVRAWRRDGAAALAIFAAIDARLALFADGDHALAVERHQFRFADLASGDGPTTLALQMPTGREKAAAPLYAALLAQLVAACGASADLDQHGRHKKRDLLVVIEAEAQKALAADDGARAPQRAGKNDRSSLFDSRMRAAASRGVRFLVQAPCVRGVAGLIGADNEALETEVRDAFAAIAALGPQTDLSSVTAAVLAGQIEVWRRWKRQPGTVARWLLPRWERAQIWIAPPERLRAAPPNEGLLLFAGFRPIRCATLESAPGGAAFIDGANVPASAHDWAAPPLAAPSKAAALAAPSQLTELSQPTEPTAPPVVTGSKLRRALSRRAAPAPRPDKGERFI